MKIDFAKGGGLIPVVIQDHKNLKVLMLGYMNEEAFNKTKKEGRVTFYSRKKEALWTKGETSGNFLTVVNMQIDCDNDTLLIKVDPNGPTCHTGNNTCFNDNSPKGFIYKLEATINSRIDEKSENSYTFKLFQKGINKIAQKVGEEAVELVIEAKDNDMDLFKNEAADLMYHYLLLLKVKGLGFEDIEEVLTQRHR